MTKVNKTKRLIAVISVLIVLLVGTFLLRGLSLRKSPRNKITQKVEQEAVRAEDITASVSSQETNDESAKAIEKAPPQQLTDDDRFSNLELPSPFEEGEIDRMLYFVGNNDKKRIVMKQISESMARNSMAFERICENQDTIMSTWPTYSVVREQLRKELAAQIDINKLTQEELIHTAAEFRKNFWRKGGCLSTTSYRDAYMARILLEHSYNHNPGNLTTIDELVETVQTANLLFKFNREKNKNILNEEVVKTLLDLRVKQFELIRSQLAEGRKPTLQNFVSACDLTLLYQYHDKAKAKEVVQWLQSKANEGGWYKYNDVLAKAEKAFDQGSGFAFNIYSPTTGKDPDALRYGRRLPSFRGPQERSIVLWGAADELPGVQITTGDGRVVDFSLR